MIYLFVQILFAAVFYPLFLIMLSSVVTFLNQSPHQLWKKYTAISILLASGTLTYFSLSIFQNPSNELATYLISSTVFFVVLTYYFCKLAIRHSTNRRILIYCLLTILLPLLDLALLYTGQFSPLNNLQAATLQLTLLVDLCRWPLTLLLALVNCISQKLYKHLFIIAAGFIAFIYLLLAITHGVFLQFN